MLLLINNKYRYESCPVSATKEKWVMYKVCISAQWCLLGAVLVEASEGEVSQILPSCCCYTLGHVITFLTCDSTHLERYHRSKCVTAAHPSILLLPHTWTSDTSPSNTWSCDTSPSNTWGVSVGPWRSCPVLPNEWQLIHHPSLSHHLHWVKRSLIGLSSLLLPAAEMLLLQQMTHRKWLMPPQSYTKLSGVPSAFQWTQASSAGGVCFDLSYMLLQCDQPSPLYCSGELAGICK